MLEGKCNTETRDELGYLERVRIKMSHIDLRNCNIFIFLFSKGKSTPQNFYYQQLICSLYALCLEYDKTMIPHCNALIEFSCVRNRHLWWLVEEVLPGDKILS